MEDIKRIVYGCLPIFKKNVEETTSAPYLDTVNTCVHDLSIEGWAIEGKRLLETTGLPLSLHL